MIRRCQRCSGEATDYMFSFIRFVFIPVAARVRQRPLRGRWGGIRRHHLYCTVVEHDGANETQAYPQGRKLQSCVTRAGDNLSKGKHDSCPNCSLTPKVKSSKNLTEMRDEVHNYQLIRLTVQTRFLLYLGLGLEATGILRRS